jgi:hypothetical protein
VKKSVAHQMQLQFGSVKRGQAKQTAVFFEKVRAECIDTIDVKEACCNHVLGSIASSYTSIQGSVSSQLYLA